MNKLGDCVNLRLEVPNTRECYIDEIIEIPCRLLVENLKEPDIKITKVRIKLDFIGN